MGLFSLSGSLSAGKSTTESTTNDSTRASTGGGAKNKGRIGKVVVKGDASGAPSPYIWIGALVLLFLVILGIIFRS